MFTREIETEEERKDRKREMGGERNEFLYIILLGSLYYFIGLYLKIKTGIYGEL